ncbi:uncharacterized protein LOC133992303 [Scomber scombrus]|uniref:uncharacterized protein LOC133992303 n=1 Tax=Scomber scombrus TaxID=13677 RepID=UPI002DDABA37|nr:uncharacterized protein LOC133992303 [Scomber scombrus]
MVKEVLPPLCLINTPWRRLPHLNHSVSATNWSFEPDSVVTMETPRRSDPGRTTPSPRPQRTTFRPSHLQDYEVDYGDAKQQPATSSLRHEVRLSSSLPSLYESPGPSNPSANLMQQIVETAKQQSETAKQQSETAKRQTELLEQVLLRTTPQSSARSSRAASRQQSPWAHLQKSVSRMQPALDDCRTPKRLEDTQAPAQHSPPLAAEEQPSPKPNYQPSRQLYPSPPPLNRTTPFNQSASFMPFRPIPLIPKDHQQSYTLQHCDPQAQSQDYTNQVLSVPLSQPIDPTQLNPAHNFTPIKQDTVIDRHVSPPVADLQLKPKTSWYVPPHPLNHVEGPTFPDFTREDRAQYVELRLSLNNLLHQSQSEQYKYALLLKHVKTPNAHRLVLAHAESSTPYTNALQALDRRYGRPYQFVLKEIETLENLPPIRAGDERALDDFSLRVQAIVGMLKSLKDDGVEELHSGSNVKRLLNRLPRSQQQRFRRHQIRKNPNQVKTSLLEFAEWLQLEADCLEFDPTDQAFQARKEQKPRPIIRQATVMYGAEHPQVKTTPAAPPPKVKGKAKIHCPYCDSVAHYLSQCTDFAALTRDLAVSWIKENKRCWRCARSHLARDCDLKKPCHLCKGKHLSSLHDVNQRSPAEPVDSPSESATLYTSNSETLYLDQSRCGGKVFLKVVKVTLHQENRAFETHAILDDGSERTILLSSAAQHLGLRGTTEALKLRTVHQDIKTVHGASVSFSISPADKPHKKFHIQDAFTANHLGLAEYTYSLSALQQKYRHLEGLSIPSLHKVRPTLLIGSDHPELIVPIEPVRLGPPGGPAAVKTCLGWTLQGPSKHLQDQLSASQCLFTSASPKTDLYHQVERLWQLDTLPFRSEKVVTRSKQDQEAVDMLDRSTVRVEINGIHRYATPLLRAKDMPRLQAHKEAAMSYLRSTERRLAKDPPLAITYKQEIDKLERAGYAKKLTPQEVEHSSESWYVPHHIVSHHGKHRIVFNCSFSYKGHNLNNYLLPGPTLGSSLLGVLVRFREHPVAISGDIKQMFHQVRLLPSDQPLLRFLWRDLQSENPPDVYEWRVLPFGTTCSPCCATFALQRHMLYYSETEDRVRHAVQKHFYVDNCLLSTSSPEEARDLVDKLRVLLASGGFEIRQWASNVASVVSHLPAEAKSESAELWISESQADPQEHALGLSWHCSPDTLQYQHRSSPLQDVTMRNIYRTLASQYDPIGYILPFTTRAKVLVQCLWAKEREWDDPLLPSDLLQAWNTWEGELQHLTQIKLPRCYTTPDLDGSEVTRELHVFCDASEVAYGSVAYLRTEDRQGNVQVSFVLARSRVAPKRALSMPRLELCAALTGAQLSRLLHNELTLEIKNTVLWSDSSTVLMWLQSESCRFKVFVGNRIAEIHELTEGLCWRYVDSGSNPADDITRGKTLLELARPNRWSQGPPFLYQVPESWPTLPAPTIEGDTEEFRKPKFCGLTTTGPSAVDATQYASFKDLVEANCRSLDGVAQPPDCPSAADYQLAETTILRQAQIDCFPEEYKALETSKPISSGSCLITLSPEFDSSMRVIRVGGRLRQVEGLSSDAVHPIVLHPKHPRQGSSTPSSTPVSSVSKMES